LPGTSSCMAACSAAKEPMQHHAHAVGAGQMDPSPAMPCAAKCATSASHEPSSCVMVCHLPPAPPHPVRVSVSGGEGAPERG
jgi:hypothetical protein